MNENLFRSLCTQLALILDPGNANNRDDSALIGLLTRQAEQMSLTLEKLKPPREEKRDWNEVTCTLFAPSDRESILMPKNRIDVFIPVNHKERSILWKATSSSEELVVTKCFPTTKNAVKMVQHFTIFDRQIDCHVPLGLSHPLGFVTFTKGSQTKTIFCWKKSIINEEVNVGHIILFNGVVRSVIGIKGTMYLQALVKDAACNNYTNLYRIGCILAIASLGKKEADEAIPVLQQIAINEKEPLLVHAAKITLKSFGEKVVDAPSHLPLSEKDKIDPPNWVSKREHSFNRVYIECPCQYEEIEFSFNRLIVIAMPNGWTFSGNDEFDKYVDVNYNNNYEKSIYYLALKVEIGMFNRSYIGTFNFVHPKYKVRQINCYLHKMGM
jgi:hypothetical protein